MCSLRKEKGTWRDLTAFLGRERLERGHLPLLWSEVSRPSWKQQRPFDAGGSRQSGPRARFVLCTSLRFTKLICNGPQKPPILRSSYRNNKAAEAHDGEASDFSRGRAGRTGPAFARPGGGGLPLQAHHHRGLAGGRHGHGRSDAALRREAVAGAG